MARKRHVRIPLGPGYAHVDPDIDPETLAALERVMWAAYDWLTKTHDDEKLHLDPPSDRPAGPDGGTAPSGD